MLMSRDRKGTSKQILAILQASRTTNRPDKNVALSSSSLVKSSSDGQDDADSLIAIPFPLEWMGLGALLTCLTAFILVNQFVGPWPTSLLEAMSPPQWLLLHYLGGVLFAGGIVVSTALEWLVVETAAASGDDEAPNNVAPVLDFLFQRVPIMDAALVVPGLALALVSGVAVAAAYYNGLAAAPTHIVWAFRTLVAFAAWWGLTDVATQGPAAAAVQEWKEQLETNNKDDYGGVSTTTDLPRILYQRRLSNIGSCLFVVALYSIMALKPGYYF